MKTLKTFFILSLVVLLLGFMASCKKAKNPYSPNIPKIIDDKEEDDPLSEENYPSEIIGKYYGAPLILTGNKFEITLKSVEFKKTVQGVISGGTWYSDEYGFVIYRYKIKNLLEKSPYDPGQGCPFPMPWHWVEAPSGTRYEWIGLGGAEDFVNDCFPDEKCVRFPDALYPQEEGDFIGVAEIPEHALILYLTIVFLDSEFTKKVQSFRFQLQFRMMDID